MNVLVACEESQKVCIELRSLGVIAYSCDIIECSGGHPEWHIKGDVLEVLNGNCNFITMDGTVHGINKNWDMIIAFPPCTHLANSGARHFEKKRIDGRQRDGIEFFGKILTAECEHIMVENPANIISGTYILNYFPDLCKKYDLPRKPTQIIQPWMFGDNVSKTTCLWLKGLNPLVPDTNVKPTLNMYEWTDKFGRTKRQDKWYMDALKLPADERAKVRSKTFDGIAHAIATQFVKQLQ